VSNIHVELKLHANDGGGGWLLVKDTSSNGTGLIDKGRSARTAIALPRGEWRPVQPGQGLLIPLWEPGVVMMGWKDTTIWLEKAGKSMDVVEMEPVRTEVAKLPIKDPILVPPTWPKAWARLPLAVQEVWIKEGIEDNADLLGVYTSDAEIHEMLEKEGIPKPERDQAVAQWRDSGRVFATATSSTEEKEMAKKPSAPPVPQGSFGKKRRMAPKILNAPGIAHLQWQKKQVAQTAKAVAKQGLGPAENEHLENIWGMFLRAGRASSLRRDVREGDEEAYKCLILKPFERYSDSLQPRLTAWKRWEAWVRGQESDPASAFRPTDVMVGKFLLEVDRGGPTAASQAWQGLKWWATRLGLDLALESPLLQDFRLKKQGHTTRQAEVLPLNMVALLRVAAMETGTRGTFASMMLLVGGGCIRWLHLQRSEIVDITEDLVVCRCAKGKRRQHGIREAYRWATPRCWAPNEDTLARAVNLVKDVATKAPTYGDKPFLVPDLTTGQGHSIDPKDMWLPRPMSYPKYVNLMRTFLKELGGGEDSSLTFNALRRLMPTGADVLQFPDTIAAGIGNWQDVPRGSSEKKRGRLKEQMAKRYAGDKVLTAGGYKLQIAAAIWEVQATDEGASSGWSQMRHRWTEKRSLQKFTMNFKTDLKVRLMTNDPGCLPEVPKGMLKHRREAPPRVVPALDKVAWSMQFLATRVQHPWVHFSAVTGEKPYCRSTKFRKDPVLQGLGVASAARTGERPCPKCVQLMGASAAAVMAEFCVADKGLVALP
jgi:hypothetical protein